MNTPIYTYLAENGVEYDGNLSQLKDWVRRESLALDDTVIEFLTGKSFKVRELISEAEMPVVGPYAAANFAYPPRTPVFAAVPSRIRSRFNWGALFLPHFWSLAHHNFDSFLLSFIPFGNIYIASNAYDWAWKSGRFRTVEECEQCQDVWNLVAMLLLILLFLLIVYIRYITYPHRPR